MIRIYRIPALGTPEVIEVEPTGAAYRKVVGGWLEGVTLTDHACLYMDEEAVDKGRVPNVVATLAVDQFRPGYSAHHTIRGDAVIVGSDDHGHEVDVPGSVVSTIDTALGWRWAP